MPPNARSAGFVMYFDPGTIPSIRARFYPAFGAHLIITLGEVVESILETARSLLVPLQEDHVPYDNIMGGYDTGKMSDDLTYFLVDQITDGVYYEMTAPDVAYWKWVEFGHFVHTKDGPRWWEGYHFFEKAIKAHEKAIFKAAQLAWHRAAIEQSSVSQYTANSRGTLSADLIKALSAAEQSL